MKTKNILSQSDFSRMVISENSGSIQNNDKFYVQYGTIGLSIIRLKDSKQRHLNFYQQFKYKQFCSVMDSLDFE
jgi:hypothetical protein